MGEDGSGPTHLARTDSRLFRRTRGGARMPNRIPSLDELSSSLGRYEEGPTETEGNTAEQEDDSVDMDEAMDREIGHGIGSTCSQVEADSGGDVETKIKEVERQDNRIDGD